jgi:hypothetical protein
MKKQTMAIQIPMTMMAMDTGDGGEGNDDNGGSDASGDSISGGDAAE